MLFFNKIARKGLLGIILVYLGAIFLPPAWDAATGHPESARARLENHFLARHVLHERAKAKAMAMAKTLNLHMPSFAPLADFIQSHGASDPGAPAAYLPYYRRVVEYMPQVPEGHGLLGFCAYHHGETAQAIALYQRAMGLNPHFFWFPYNLGLILFQQGRFAEAAPLLDQALRSRPEMVFKAVQASRLYQQIIAGKENFQYPFGEELKAGYRNSCVLLVLSFYSLKDFSAMRAAARQAVALRVGEEGLFQAIADGESQNLLDSLEILRTKAAEANVRAF